MKPLSSLALALVLAGCSAPAAEPATPAPTPSATAAPSPSVRPAKSPEEEALWGATSERVRGVIKSVEVVEGRASVVMYQPKSYPMAEANALDLCAAAVEAFDAEAVTVEASDGLLVGYRRDAMRCRVIE